MPGDDNIQPEIPFVLLSDFFYFLLCLYVADGQQYVVFEVPDWKVLLHHKLQSKLYLILLVHQILYHADAISLELSQLLRIL